MVAHCHCALHDLLSLRLYIFCRGYWHDRDYRHRDSLSGLPTMVNFDYLFYECLHGDMSNYPFVYRNSLVHEFVFFRNSILHEFVLLLEFVFSLCTDVGALQILTLF